MSPDIVPTAIRIPLVGRVGCRIPLSAALVNDMLVQVHFFKGQFDALPFTTKDSDAGGVIITDGPNEVYAELTDSEAAELSPNRLGRIEVRLVDIDDDTNVLAVQTFALIASATLVDATFPMSLTLSTRFLNTLALLGEAGGDGYLDGVSTAGQNPGCFVEFRVEDTPPEQWVLEAGTEATDPGVIRRPLDYSANNQKFWRKIL